MRYIVSLTDTVLGSVQPLFLSDSDDDVRLMAEWVKNQQHIQPAARLPLPPAKRGYAPKKVKVLKSSHPDFPVGSEFHSALVASIALGYTYNALGQARALAKKLGKPEVGLRGITFSWEGEDAL